MSERVSLPKGYEFNISDDIPSSVLTINKVIGRGGSCIVYDGIKTEHINEETVDRNVVIKEFYPESIEIDRLPDMSLKAADSEMFEILKKNFCEGQHKHILYYNENQDKSLPSAFLYINANNTIYAVADSSNGTALSQIDQESITLNTIASIMESICTAIRRIHIHKKVYLDCKPDNFFYYGNDYDLQKQVYLFDFDTCSSIKDIKEENNIFCSASLGWAPEEQEIKKDIVKGSSYRFPQQIGYHTDIYSIGATFFWLLTRRKPTRSDLDSIQAHNFDWAKESKQCSGLEPDVYKIIQDIAETTLQPSVDKRSVMFRHYIAINAVREQFSNLYGITAGGNIHFEPIHAAIKRMEESIKEDLNDIKSDVHDTQGKIEESRTSIEDTIKKNSLKHFLFGTKKRIITTISLFILVLVISTAICTVVSKAINKNNYVTVAEIDTEMDDHIILKLSNANHQYEEGIENWRRLDYIRAERDISASLNDISEEKSQAEIDVAIINNSLGCLYLDMGRYKDAYDCLNSAYVTFKDSLGEQSIESRAARASIAQYFYSIGNLEQALVETQYILDNSDKELEKAVITRTSHLRAMILDAQGKYEDALTLYENVLEMYSDIANDGKLSEELANYANDPNLSQSEKDYYTNSIKWIMLTYSNIAKVDIHKENYSAAIEAANKGLEFVDSNDYITQRSITVAKLYMNLAIAQGKTDDIKTALDNIDLSKRILRNLFQFQDIFPGLVEVFDIYGELLIQKGDFDEAQTYFEDAVELSRSALGENHPDTADALDALGNYHRLMDKSEKAVEDLEAAIEIRKNILADNHPITAKMYYDLSLAQIATNDNTSAKENLTKAKEICEEWNVQGSLIEDINKALSDL